MEMEEDSFVELALRFARNGRTKGHGCQCLTGAKLMLSWCFFGVFLVPSHCLVFA